jgi:hypothetical protein
MYSLADAAILPASAPGDENVSQRTPVSFAQPGLKKMQ